MRKTLLGMTLLSVALIASVAVRTLKAEEAKKATAPQNWYVIETTHTGPECVKALDDMNSNSLLSKTYWACMSGDHRGWTILQAPNQAAALQMVPESQRAEAKIAQVGKFTPADLQAIHKKG